ncbi:hypothetical protein [Agrobacterium sp. SORGH_AS 787]|uniref:hypothetical protein n=1 Tax=Agrobacterium sp. SORGH_AS 787 TaxID=3041775 RepID=UPI00277E1DF6|nr:hypothetical protein [Rhizobium sp. SORGH_AS_0787]
MAADAIGGTSKAWCDVSDSLLTLTFFVYRKTAAQFCATGFRVRAETLASMEIGSAIIAVERPRQ